MTDVDHAVAQYQRAVMDGLAPLATAYLAHAIETIAEHFDLHPIEAEVRLEEILAAADLAAAHD